MALDTYANLQTSILNWLARPGDTLISAAAPDMIALFEAAARDRLRTRFEEVSSTLTATGGTATVALPADFWEFRGPPRLRTNPVVSLVYMAPAELYDTWASTTTDRPVNYTIEGLNLKFGPTPDAVYTVDIDYMQGLPSLSDSAPTNWLLTRYPDLYLFGSLVMAEAFIGDDDRAVGWLQATEGIYARIAESDRKARWSGGPLTVQTDVRNP